jgi:hypothetical protein
MTSIVITPFNDEHAEELMGFIRNELDNADFEGEDMPAHISLQDVVNDNLRAALVVSAARALVDALDRELPHAAKHHAAGARANLRSLLAVYESAHTPPTTKE